MTARFDKQTLVPAFSAVLLVGMCVFLANWSKLQRLGEPGVKVGLRPTHMTPEKGSANNALTVVRTNSVMLPELVLGYESQELPLDPLVWNLLPKDTTYGQRRYSGIDGFWVDQIVVLMGADRTSIHKPEFCLTGGGWQIYSAEHDSIPMVRPIPYELPVRKMLLRSERKHPITGQMIQLEGVFVFWFVSEDKMTSEHGERMWWMARDLLTKGELQRWAYVIAFSVCEPGRTEQTYERMTRFIQAATPEFQLVPKPQPLAAQRN